MMAGGTVEVYFAFFGSFSEYDTVHAGEVNVLPVQTDQFTDAHSSRVQEFNYGEISFLLTGTAQNLSLFVRQRVV